MRRTLGVLAVMAGMTLTLAGCAKGPPAADALSLAPPVPSDRTRLIVYSSSLFGFLSRADVFVNRRRLGPVEGQGALYADVEPGVQTIAVNSQEGKSTLLRTLPGEVVYVRLESFPTSEWTGDLTPVRVPDAVGQQAMSKLRMANWQH